MVIVELTPEEYIKKWKELSDHRRIECPNIDPAFRRIKSSDARFSNEYERLTWLHFNPPEPLHIDFYEADGMVRYVKKRHNKL